MVTACLLNFHPLATQLILDYRRRQPAFGGLADRGFRMKGLWLLVGIALGFFASQAYDPESKAFDFGNFGDTRSAQAHRPPTMGLR
jgi:hypothetical protein